MGVELSVWIEGRSGSAIEWRADPKILAEVVTGWISDEPLLVRLGIPEETLKPLWRIDPGAYAEDEAEREAADAWQDPQELRGALAALLAAVTRLRGTDQEAEGLREELAREYLVQVDSLEAYEWAIEDAIRVCDLAREQSKRVALVGG